MRIISSPQNHTFSKPSSYFYMSHAEIMVPPESSTLIGVYSYGGGDGFTEAMMMRNTTKNNQDFSGNTCSVSDPTAVSTYNISSSPVTTANKDDGSVLKNDAVCYNIQDKDKSWLRLGIGPEENNNTVSYKPQRFSSENSGGREKSLELSLSTAVGAVTTSSSVDDMQPQPQTQQPLYPHDQFLTMRGTSLVYNHQLIRPQTLLSRGFPFPSSKTWIPQYTSPFRQTDRDVTNNNNVSRSCCIEEGGAGPSSEFRVFYPPKRPHSGLWFLLQASQFQEKDPFLPQVSKNYLRIKDGRITVKLLIKYLVKKLQLDSESKVEIRCRGEELSPLMTIQHVRDNVWNPKSASSRSFTLLRDSSTIDHVMILHYELSDVLVARSPSQVLHTSRFTYEDKYIHKVHFSQHGIPLPECMVIDDAEGSKKADELFRLPSYDQDQLFGL